MIKSQKQKVPLKIECNGAYNSETIGTVARENSIIRIRFNINVQDIEIGEF